jgi:uncharacterized protein
MNRKPLRHVDLYSDAGRLEGLYRDIDDPSAVAVVCHPLTIGGGTLHNKVVFRTARGLERANIATLRFNFRGAGTSQGKYDKGDGETRDFEAALEWIRNKHPNTPAFAGGFSFGSWVASRASFSNPDVAALFLVGTPVNNFNFSFVKNCRKPLLFVHGTKDEHGDVQKVETLVQECRNAESVIITGADHFFGKHIDTVEETVRQWASGLLEEGELSVRES